MNTNSLSFGTTRHTNAAPVNGSHHKPAAPFVALFAVLLLALGGLVALPVTASAAPVSAAASPAVAVPESTVRAGARWGQVDILLDGVETQRAATSYWGAQTVCWGVTAAGASLGLAGVVLANLSCTSVVSVCAAQAYVAHRWAGMTVYPGGFYCWKY